MRLPRRILTLLSCCAVSCERAHPPLTPSAPAPVAVATPAPSPLPPPNRPPTATISDWQPRTTAVVGGTKLSFGARGSDPDGDTLRFSWDFDDGSTDSGEALFHVFHEQGTFTVRLIVSDGRGGSASDEVVVRARRLDGEWTVVNAKHIPMTATIKQWPNSDYIAGTTSDRSSFEGRLVDPYGIHIEYTSADDRCISSGSYEGSIFSSINEIVFPGNGCKNVRLLR